MRGANFLVAVLLGSGFLGAYYYYKKPKDKKDPGGDFATTSPVKIIEPKQYPGIAPTVILDDKSTLGSLLSRIKRVGPKIKSDSATEGEVKATFAGNFISALMLSDRAIDIMTFKLEKLVDTYGAGAVRYGVLESGFGPIELVNESDGAKVMVF